MSFDLVIFDCDGVLVDSEPIANRVFAGQLARVGVRMPWEEVMRVFMGKTKAGCLALARELASEPLPEGFVRDWDAALYAALEKEVRVVEGIVELLHSLRVPCCLASNSTPERTRVSLKATGLQPLFEGRTFSALEVPNPKPAPDLFLHAAKQLGARPGRCAVIEDSPTGVRAAVAAGMTAFGYAGSPYTSAAVLAAEGAKVFKRMAELTPLLEHGPAAR